MSHKETKELNMPEKKFFEILEQGAKESNGTSPEDRFKNARAAALEQENDHKNSFVSFTKGFITIWMLFIAIILSTRAFCPTMGLSDNVIMVLLGTTTANVFMLSLAVVRGIFQPKKY